MKRLAILFFSALVLTLSSGCGLALYSLSTSGNFQGEGSAIDCGSFIYRVHDSNRRVAPGRYGPNSLLTYQDFGSGAPWSGAFSVSPTDGFQTKRFGEEMNRISPVFKFWNEARDVEGDFTHGGIFSGSIPRIASERGNVTYIERPEILFVGQVKEIGNGKFLLLHFEDSSMGGSRKIGKLKNEFTSFSRSLRTK